MSSIFYDSTTIESRSHTMCIYKVHWKLTYDCSSFFKIRHATWFLLPLCFPLVSRPSFNRSLTPADFHVRLFADREGKQPWRVSPVIARTQIGFIHGQPPYIVACLLCTEFKRYYLCTYTLSKFLSTTSRVFRVVERSISEFNVYICNKFSSLYSESARNR